MENGIYLKIYLIEINGFIYNVVESVRKKSTT